jgi:DNA-binding NarL/FixJ family response regulator
VDALEIISNGTVDVLIFEPLSMSSGAMEFMRQSKQNCPGLRIFVLTAQSGVDFANRALKARASGYLTKDCSADQLMEAVRRVANGRLHISYDIAEKLMWQMTGPTWEGGHKALTPREFDVLLRLAAGQTCSEIARELMLSVKTISTHKARMMEKMHLESTAELVQYAVAHKLVEAYIA